MRRTDLLEFFRGCVDGYGDIFRFRRLGFPLVMVNHPDLVEQVLVTHRDKYDKDALLFRVVRPVLRGGLIGHPGGELWARQRRLMQPSFRPAAVSRFADNMTAEATKLVDRWGPRAGQVVNVTDDLGAKALAIVNRSLFSADVGRTAHAFTAAFLVANEQLARFLRFPFPPLGVPTPGHLRLRSAIAQMDAFVSAFIQRRVESGDPGEDLLALLMSATDDEGDGKGMDLGQLHAEVLNIVVGAYETTTNALSWAFPLLAQHPDVERRVHDEVDHVLGGRTATFDDFARLRYARLVADETLRLYSPAWQTMRRARADDELGGYRIPAGANIYLNSYFLHRHPDFWTDPEVFDPERFTPERIASRPKHVYIPFGSGERVCIGKHFALTEIVLVMATIAQRCRLSSPPGAAPVEPLPLITLHPKGGVRLRVDPR